MILKKIFKRLLKKKKEIKTTVVEKTFLAKKKSKLKIIQNNFFQTYKSTNVD